MIIKAYTDFLANNQMASRDNKINMMSRKGDKCVFFSINKQRYYIANISDVVSAVNQHRLYVMNSNRLRAWGGWESYHCANDESFKVTDVTERIRNGCFKNAYV